MADNPQALMAVSMVLILFSVIIIALFIVSVHTMPGKIARKRGNPQAEAVEILSLMGLLIFPLWMAALVWAYISPFSVPVQVVQSKNEDAADAQLEPKPRPEPGQRSEPPPPVVARVDDSKGEV